MLQRTLKRWLLAATIWFIGISTRKTWINWHVLETLQRQSRPYILCVWHNTILYFIYVLGPLDLPVMISRSSDGDDITWVANRFGFTGVRGSPALGGPQAMREMLRALAGGRNVVITPDGPRGPRYELKPGVTALARRKGLPIVPLTYSAPRRWEFGSWDRMRLPK
ncbi:MAG TPA: lysophospholipid acyltransferase family protein, partial [bacterium]|nr:lysophospholipid acyltransferase family protein [bacterium]